VYYLVYNKISTLNLKILKSLQLKPINYNINNYIINIKIRSIKLRIFKSIIKQVLYLYAFSTYLLQT